MALVLASAVGIVGNPSNSISCSQSTSFPRPRLEFGSSGRDSDLLARSIRGLSGNQAGGMC